MSLFLVCAPSQVLRWDMATNGVARCWGELAATGGQLAYCDKTRELVFAANDGQVHGGSPAEKTPRVTWRAARPGISQVTVSPDQKRVAVGFRDGHLVLLNWPELTFAAEFRGHSDWIYSLDFSPDGNTLVSCGRDNTTRLWDATNGQLQATLGDPIVNPRVVRFSADGNTLLAGTREGQLLSYGLSPNE